MYSKSSLLTVLFMSLALVISSGELASALTTTTYSPDALNRLIERTQALAATGQPVILFDLDDTLINTRERTVRILLDFVSQPQVHANFLDASTKISGLQFEQVQYQLTDTMANLGIKDAAFIKLANDFWLAHFFSNEYSAEDLPTKGAAKYLHLLARAGAKIVYLTGRDVGRMGVGTRENLIRNRFPMNPDQAVLILKQDKNEDDLKFKESQYDAVAAMGKEVIGVFENEPANINSMAKNFPTAQAIFLDTIHSPNPAVPVGRVEWVPDFDFR
jgi:predicted secreted acid phosphatase